MGDEVYEPDRLAILPGHLNLNSQPVLQPIPKS
jgi:hypothetical protein